MNNLLRKSTRYDLPPLLIPRNITLVFYASSYVTNLSDSHENNYKYNY